MSLALLPRSSRAKGPWAGSGQFRLGQSPAGDAAGSLASSSVVVALTPGSALIAQAGSSSPDPAAGGWQFTIAPYLWAPRTDIDLTVGNLSRSTTIDFSEIVENFDIGFSGHFEATWREWTFLLDLLYMKLEKDETTGAGIRTDLDYQQLFFEFGGTYRVATLPVGRTGRITLEALAGGRLMFVNAELSIGPQQRSRTATLIDPMFGGRIAYHITDAIALWFLGDVAGFGISDSQSQLTYNLIAGLSWRFAHVASLFAGWRYMHVDIEKGSGATTLDADVSMNGPFVGVNFYF